MSARGATRLSLIAIWGLTLAYIFLTPASFASNWTLILPGSGSSVSVSLEFSASMGASWFTQTSYGAAFWQATAYLRSFRYVARPTRY